MTKNHGRAKVDPPWVELKLKVNKLFDMEDSFLNHESLRILDYF